MKQSIGGRRQRATEAGSDGFGKDFPADEVLCLALRYHDVGEELSQIVHGVIAPGYGNVDSRQGAVFELNHFVAIKQCSPVGSTSPARQDVGGKSKTKAQRRIDSFRCFIPLPMTMKEETSDRLTATTEQTPTTRQQEETNVEVQLNHKPPTEREEPNSQPRMTDFGMGFILHTSRSNFGSPRDSLESRSLSSETSVLHGLTTWRRLHYAEDEDTVICHSAQNTSDGHVSSRCSLHHQWLHTLEGCHAKEGWLFATRKMACVTGKL